MLNSVCSCTFLWSLWSLNAGKMSYLNYSRCRYLLVRLLITISSSFFGKLLTSLLLLLHFCGFMWQPFLNLQPRWYRALAHDGSSSVFTDVLGLEESENGGERGEGCLGWSRDESLGEGGSCNDSVLRAGPPIRSRDVTTSFQ